MSTSILKAFPGKRDIKRREPGILFINLQVDTLFKLAIMTSLSSFVAYRSNVIDDVIKNAQRHDDLIKAHAREIGNVYQVNVQQCSKHER